MSNDMEEAWIGFAENKYEGFEDCAIYAAEKHTFIEGYNASQPNQGGWVAIDDPIVETWKDGRFVLIWPKDKPFKEIPFARWNMNEKWWVANFGAWNDENLTHAMLPPNPPTKET
tara:strand:+ start:3957 stop:4301 length:345 start_codon:yes stop_codon:yes gene_type:complete